MKLTFITGTCRCGSTLVHEILAKHESFGLVSNVEDNITEDYQAVEKIPEARPCSLYHVSHGNEETPYIEHESCVSFFLQIPFCSLGGRIARRVAQARCAGAAHPAGRARFMV